MDASGVTPRTVYMPEEALGLTVEQAQEQAGKAQSKWAHFTPDFVGTQTPTVDVADAFKVIESATRLFTEARTSQPEGKAVFKTQLPILLVFLGDIHLGSAYTDHQRFLREWNAIKAHPNAYIVLMANLIDNAIPSQFPANMLVNVIPPDKQVVVMRRLLQEANDRIVAAVTAPCHEGWTWRHTGQDINALLYGFPERKFPVLENGGTMDLEVARQSYLMALYHQVGPFESNFNETHALRQMNRLNLNMRADIIAGAHRHFSAAEMVYEGTGEERKPVAYLRTGTYKGISQVHDLFNQDRRGSTGEPSAQAVILWPDTRRMDVYLELETALQIHKALCLSALANEND